MSSKIETIAELEAMYGQPVEAAPFAALATSGPEGLDCSPRGDVVS